MGWLFEDRSLEAYERASEAVSNGTDTELDRELNDRAASQQGDMGNRAREAKQKKANRSKSGGWIF